MPCWWVEGWHAHELWGLGSSPGQVIVYLSPYLSLPKSQKYMLEVPLNFLHEVW